MLEIFLINRVFYNGDAGYNDNTLLGYVTSEEAAIKKVACLNEFHKQADLFKTKIDDYFYKTILPSLPPFDQEEYPQYPKWRPGIRQDEITEEMRSERNRIIKLQEECRERVGKKSQIRKELGEKLKQEYTDSLGISPDVMKTMEDEDGYDDVLRYAYEKIEELK